jgi:hypothetical protein
MMKYVLALSLWLSGQCSCVASLAVQSGPENDGDSVAGGITFDSKENVLHITGASTGAFFGGKDPSSTNCFLATVSLDSPNSPWSSRQMLGNSDVPESCAAVMRMGDKDQLFIAGASLEDGLLSELRARGSLQSTVYGMLIQLNLAEINGDEGFTLEGGHLMHESKVQYPISMTRDSEVIYVASVVSEDVLQNQEYAPFVPLSFKYGSEFTVMVQRYSLYDTVDPNMSLQRTLVSEWDRSIGVQNSDVYVGGLLYMSGSSLILAGSTQGTDDAFPDANPGGDLDGFVTELNTTDGKLTPNSYRIESQPGLTEKVYGMCKQEGAASILYVVGVTTGDLKGTETRDPTEHAFLMKLSVAPSSGFKLEWVQQVGATVGEDASGMSGMACAVTSDGSLVYMVGRVDSGAVVNHPGNTPSGGTDIFCMQVEQEAGAVNFIHQFGSAEDDFVADVVVDTVGNALVYGTTLGTLYRDNAQKDQDVFILEVSRADGTFEGFITPNATGVQTPAPVTAVTTTAPAPTTAAATTAPAPTTAAATTAPDPTMAAATTAPAPTPASTTTSAGALPESNENGKGGKIAVSILIILAFVMAALFVARRRRHKDILSDEDHVVEYLKGFDDVEVDLKHSATGGWHGTYLNPRYASDGDTYSYNSDTIETSVRFDSSNAYVRDSLFMDDYDTPNLGMGEDDEDGDERMGLTNQRSNYDGLVDAYNTTWDDLSPHVMPTSRTPYRSKRDLSDKKHVMETIDFMRDDDAWGKEII